MIEIPIRAAMRFASSEQDSTRRARGAFGSFGRVT